MITFKLPSTVFTTTDQQIRDSKNAKKYKNNFQEKSEDRTFDFTASHHDHGQTSACSLTKRTNRPCRVRDFGVSNVSQSGVAPMAGDCKYMPGKKIFVAAMDSAQNTGR
jgi:hypothetical protein